MKEEISSIISFFCTIIIVGVDNMEKVPSMISTKDLDYLTDMFHWNYLCYKCMNNASLEVVDKEIKNMIEKSMALFDDNMNNILYTLGGLNE